jgi:hypothetical protein
MRQGLVSQDIAAGNASFVEVFSHEALSGALHHDLRFGPYPLLARKKLPARTD